jgi:uncharacterized membrane protein
MLATDSAQKIRASTGKHVADPIGANFLKGKIRPSGSLVAELLDAYNASYHGSGNKSLTKWSGTLSLASFISSVTQLLGSREPNNARDRLIS